MSSLPSGPLLTRPPPHTGTLSRGLWYTTATLFLSIRWRPSMMVGALRYRQEGGEGGESEGGRKARSLAAPSMTVGALHYRR